VKPHVLLQQAVGAHHDVHRAGFQPAQRVFDLLWGAKPREHRNFNGVGFHALQHRVEMLPCQNGGGHQQGDLLAPHHGLKRCAQGHFGLAHTHVAAEQAVHRPRVLHINFDLAGGRQLVIGLIVLKPGLKIALPLAVGGEGVPFRLFASGVQLQQVFGHFGRGLFDLGLCLDPIGAAQFRKAHLFAVTRRGVAAEQVQLGDRHKQRVGPGVLNFNVVFDNALQIQPLDRGVNADAVVLVHHVIAGL